MLAVLLPAAGTSRRMAGRDKLMEEIDGVPLLARQVARAIASGAPVYVTIRADRPARISALAGLNVQLVPVPDPDQGLSSSIRAGVAALPDNITALMILLPDLPDIETSDICALMNAHAAHPGHILRAVAQNGTPGHPTLFPRSLFRELAKLSGDTGAQSLLKRHGFTTVPLPGYRAITDLDTPEAWAKWRAEHAR